eukprot:COSAG01_NODE_78016_length_153_cov_69.666667_1_plen_29_part_10
MEFLPLSHRPYVARTLVILQSIQIKNVPS